jgi:hypothetical protein
MSWDPNDLPGSAAGKALARLNAIAPKTVTAIKVMTINSFEGMGADANYDITFWGSHNRNNWDDRVSYYREKPSHTVVFEGELEKDGAYAKGRVGVTEESWNSVYFGFIVTGDTIGFLGLASYSSGNYGSEDGWYTIGTTPVDTVRLGNRIP